MKIVTNGERSRTTRLFTLLVILLSLVATAQETVAVAKDDSDDLWHLENANIRKIAQFTATEHAAVLFTLAEKLVGYSTAGTAYRLDLPTGTFSCQYPHPALSHDGRLVAFLNGVESKHCTIAIFEIATDRIRPLLDLTHDPGELSWSWDDSEIAFRDASVQAVSLQNGSVRTMVPASQLTIDGTQFGLLLHFDGSAPVQWTHGGSKLLVGFVRDVPTRQPNAYTPEFPIELANDGVLSRFGYGDDATVSPVADRVAWYSHNRLVMANLDGTNPQVLTGPPRWMGIFPEDLGKPLTWAPDGTRLFFRVVMSENYSDDVYLLKVDTRHYKRFLNHTSIAIRDWR